MPNSNDVLYSKTTVNDDLVYTTKGTYYFNENTKRSEITISLIPDLKWEKRRTQTLFIAVN